MNTYYLSFLICDREENVDLFVNGLPIGQNINSQWVPHVKVLPDGTGVKRTLAHMPQPRPESGAALKARLLEIINSIPDDL